MYKIAINGFTKICCTDLKTVFRIFFSLKGTAFKKKIKGRCFNNSRLFFTGAYRESFHISTGLCLGTNRVSLSYNDTILSEFSFDFFYKS